MWVLALVACDTVESTDAATVAHLLSGQLEGVFHQAWCAAATDPVAADPPPGQFGCGFAEEGLTVDGTAVSGTTSSGATLDGTVTWAPDASALEAELGLDVGTTDELSRETAVRFDGPVAWTAVHPDYYDIDADASGTVTLTRPKFPAQELHGTLSRRELEAMDTLTGELSLTFGWVTRDDGNCVLSERSWTGTVGGAATSGEDSICLTLPLR